MYNPVLGYEPSEYQESIFEWYAKPESNLSIKAVAGSGKTTTLVDGIRFTKPNTRVLCLAFSREIADLLAQKLAYNPFASAMGTHQLGFKIVKDNYPNVKWDNKSVDEYKYQNLIYKDDRVCSSLGNGNINQIRDAIYQLVNFAQLTNTDTTIEALQSMADKYSIHLPFDIEEVKPIIRDVLIKGLKMIGREGKVSFNDMIYAPSKLGLSIPDEFKDFDIVGVDECQDLNTAQRLLIEKLVSQNDSTKIFTVGDPNQSIFMFAGADPNSYYQVKEHFGSEEKKLSVCYRCPLSVIELAQQIVPEIEAAPNAIDGEVATKTTQEFLKEVGKGDMVICRLTAPLVSICLRLLAMRKQARIKGKDIASRLSNIISTIEDMSSYGTFTDFPKCLDEWRDRQIDKLRARRASEDTITSICDMHECLHILFQNLKADTLEEFVGDIESLFADKASSIMLSTVHRIKGQQAKTVWIIRPDKLPLVRPDTSDAQLEQEKNLFYVAQTRAQEKLFFVQPDKELEMIGNM